MCVRERAARRAAVFEEIANLKISLRESGRERVRGRGEGREEERDAAEINVSVILSPSLPR